MQLDSLEVINFRNLSGKISWGPQLNIIAGSNGQGKTNWLEAIYLLGRSKSFRTQRLQETIAFGQPSATLSGIVSTGAEIKRELQIGLHGNTKSLFINGKRESAARYITHLQVFSFTVDDLEVVRGNPEARRRFVDRGIASLFPTYLGILTDYTRVIKQKNKLLQTANERSFSTDQTWDLLAPWHDQLVVLAGKIHRARIDYIDRLNATLEKRLFDQKDVTARYISHLEGKGDLTDYETVLRHRLALRVDAEMAAGHSLLGPHRDDVEILLDNRQIRVYGSSGQQRSALLLLDLAAISLYNSWHDDHPVFIIDDVDAELDEKRIRDLLEYLEGRTQTFITTSKRSHVEGFLSRANLYEIADGRVGNDMAESEVIPMASGFV